MPIFLDKSEGVALHLRASARIVIASVFFISLLTLNDNYIIRARKRFCVALKIFCKKTLAKKNDQDYDSVIAAKHTLHIDP